MIEHLFGLTAPFTRPANAPVRRITPLQEKRAKPEEVKRSASREDVHRLICTKTMIAAEVGEALSISTKAAAAHLRRLEEARQAYRCGEVMVNGRRVPKFRGVQ
ncbi:hypothetical protein [Thauera sp. 63]|uniref:hypothetical protein n=1 Tax=Thauera sp. 63 TaxID=497321 RepID=UPI0002CF6B99|nr:hypothetical protein [Thauera sp. 63]ENO79147.1 hypothetical protein C664_05431 [Thauera sp. 63]